MKKFFKWSAIVIGAIIVFIIIGLLALPFIFPLEKIKQFAVTRLSETLRREVKIEKVSFDLFSGIKLQGLFVGDRKEFGNRAFIKADAIVLRYAFWPLFSRQIIVKEASLVKPEVIIEKNLRGEFNFSDLLQSKKAVKPTTQPPINPTAKPPFDLFVTSFSLREGKVSFIDRAAKSTSEIRDLNFNLSGFELALIKPIEARLSANLVYQGKTIPLSVSAKIGFDLPNETMNINPLNFSLAGESAAASITISDFGRTPDVDFSLSTKKLSLDPLLAIIAAPAATNVKKPALRPGELTKAVNRSTAAIPGELKIKGKLDLENITFQKFAVDRANLTISLANKTAAADIKEVRLYNGTLSGRAQINLATSGLGYNVQDLKLTGLDSTPLINSLVEALLVTLPDYKDLTNKVYGTLNASLSLKGQGVEPQDIMKNAVGNGSFSIKGGELKRLKTLAEVGKTIHSNTLQQDLRFGDLSAAFDFKNRVINTSGLHLDNPDIKLNYKGGVDLGKLVWLGGNRLSLKLSPTVAKEIPKELSLFKDESGWLELVFEITGPLSKPFPKPILEKPIEKAIGKIKLKIEAKQIEIQQAINTKEAELKKAAEEAKASAEAEAKAKADAEAQRLKEEAKQKAKKLLGF